MVFRFKIKIEGIKTPQVWRGLDIPSSWTFERFNDAIQAAFGWQHCHLWEFTDKIRGYGEGTMRIAGPSEYDVEYEAETLNAFTTKLSLIFPIHKVFTYIYDMGDYWKHEIRLIEVIDEDKRKAKCIEGRGTCPPEDCGGAPGYAEMKEAFKKENCQAETYREWLGFEEDETWNPDYFNLKEVNEALKNI